MSTARNVCILVALAPIICVAGFFIPGAQGKQKSRVEVNPQPLPPGFFSGLVGLSSGQHIRLSVASVLPKPQPGQPPQNPGVVLLELFSELGELLQQRVDQIPDGESTSLDRSFEELTANLPPGTTPNRLELRAVAFGVVGPAHPRGSFRASLEIYDADTGKTRVGAEVIIAFLEGDPDQPIIIGKISSDPVRFLPGLTGLASGQHARISVASLLPRPEPAAAPGDPTAVELTFFTDQGAVIATSRVEVGEAESKFLEISFEDAVNAVPPGPPSIPTAPPNRLEIRAAAVAIPNTPAAPGAARHPPNPCLPSLEIYDVATGKTTVALLPAVQR